MFELVVLAMVAAFILLRLRSELGKKTGDEPRQPLDPRPAERGRFGPQPVPDQRGKIIDMAPEPLDDPHAHLPADVQDGLRALARADRHFDFGTFIDGARSAYGMILEAFWAGDRRTLKDFLDDQVFTQFESAVNMREQKNLKVENRILDIVESDLVAVKMQGKVAELTVQFKADIVAVTRDASGKVVEGNVSDTVSVTDRWTFARDTGSRDPSWTLVATRAG